LGQAAGSQIANGCSEDLFLDCPNDHDEGRLSHFDFHHPEEPGEVIVAQPQNRIDKYLLALDIAHFVKHTNANGLIHIAEAWMAAYEDIPKGKFAEHVKERGEVLTLAAVNSDGERIHLSTKITRKFLKRWKVKELAPTEIEVGGQLISMAPVLEVWGRLDVLDLDADDESSKWAEQHFEHDEPSA
jgi:hypothetical protein